jgi:hypothetical protein
MDDERCYDPEELDAQQEHDGRHRELRALRAEIDCLRTKLAVAQAPLPQPPTEPCVVCLCGSTRFRAAYERAFYEEEHAGRICLTAPCFKDDPCCKTPEDHARLDELHLRKIDLADEILVLNVGGYVGESTWREIAYARSQGKPIRWLEEPAS